MFKYERTNQVYFKLKKPENLKNIYGMIHLSVKL